MNFQEAVIEVRHINLTACFPFLNPTSVKVCFQTVGWYSCSCKVNTALQMFTISRKWVTKCLAHRTGAMRKDKEVAELLRKLFGSVMPAGLYLCLGVGDLAIFQVRSINISW